MPSSTSCAQSPHPSSGISSSSRSQCSDRALPAQLRCRAPRGVLTTPWARRGRSSCCTRRVRVVGVHSGCSSSTCCLHFAPNNNKTMSRDMWQLSFAAKCSQCSQCSHQCSQCSQPCSQCSHLCSQCSQPCSQCSWCSQPMFPVLPMLPMSPTTFLMFPTDVPNVPNGPKRSRGILGTVAMVEVVPCNLLYFFMYP